MNDIIDLMLRHRSVREYADEPIPDQHIHAAVRAGQRASTSSNIQAYCLIRITDPSTREQLVELTGGQSKVATCGAFFVVAGDTRRHRLACARNGTPYDARLEAFLLATVDASLFAQNLVLAFESMGYGICYIGGLRRCLPRTGKLLELPHGVYPLFGLCVGVPCNDSKTGLEPRPRLPMQAVYFEDRYPDDERMEALLDDYDMALGRYEGARREAIPPWTARMAEKFAQPRRTDVGDFYRSQGADPR